MGVQPQTLAVLTAGAVLRIVVFLFFPGVLDVLTSRVEISTPISSYKRLQEGLFLYERGVSPYDGGIYHQAPLLLAVFELFPASLIFTGLDLLNAYGLASTAERLNLPSPRFQKLNGTTVAAAYLFNPFTILSCLGRSTNIFANAAIIQAITSALAGNGFGAMFATAVGSYLSIYPALILPPLLLLYGQNAQQKLNLNNALTHVGYFAATLTTLMATTLVLTDSFWDYLVSCYGAQIAVTDLTPNVGLWWYFFIEMFDAFRDFFVGLFWLHLIGYVGPMTVRLPDQPLFVIISLLGLFANFKPYSSLSDMSLYLGVLPLYKHIFPLTRYTFISSSVLLYATFLGPAFHYIWIYAGSGNANFFYAITLVWSLGVSMLVGDTFFAVLRDEWEMTRPEMRGKDVRQI